MYEEYVVFPSTCEEHNKHAEEFDVAGFTGAFGLAYAAHIVLERCKWAQRQEHVGFNLNLTSRSHNFSVNHRCRIFYVANGFPVKWNDKTIVKFYRLARGLKEGKMLNNNKFILFECREDRKTKEKEY